MNKTVLLARPHPFIVAEMKPFLEQSGYNAVKPEKLDDMASIARSSAGAAISLAVSSALGKPETFLYISKDDLADAARRAIASRMVRRHFR